MSTEHIKAKMNEAELLKKEKLEKLKLKYDFATSMTLKSLEAYILSLQEELAEQEKTSSVGEHFLQGVNEPKKYNAPGLTH